MVETYTALTPGVIAVLDLGATYDTGTTIVGQAHPHASADPGFAVEMKWRGYIIPALAPTPIGDYGGDLGDAIDTKIPLEPAAPGFSTAGDFSFPWSFPSDGAWSGALIAPARYLLLVLEPHAFPTEWFSDGLGDFTATPTGSIIVPDTDPPIDEEPPPEPLPPGGAILEIYVSEPGGARWGVSHWGVDDWASSAWVDVTPESIDATILWGSQSPEYGIVSKVVAGSWAVTTYDPERLLDPANESGPYYGDLIPTLPIRLRHQGTVIRWGHCVSIGYSYAHGQYRGYIRASDSVALLANGLVPADTDIADTLYARAADVIAAAELHIAVGNPPGGVDPALAPRLEGEKSAWAHILDAGEQVFYMPYIDRLDTLQFRAWAAPYYRGRELHESELLDLEAIVDHDGLYSVVQVQETVADGDDLLERRFTPTPAYGARVYRRTEATPDANAWATTFLTDRALGGRRWIPGQLYPLSAASVQYFATIEMLELIAIRHPSASPAVDTGAKVLGGVINVRGKRDDAAVWAFEFKTAEAPPIALVDDQTESEFLMDESEVYFLYAG